MSTYISRIIVAAAILLASSHIALAQSTDYQMLPPTYAGTTTPCTTGSTGHNQVLFFGGSPSTSGESAINCLSNGFTVDPTNGFVGIGTATPAYPLDIAGDVKFTGRLGLNGFDPASGYPSTWGGGLHLWDAYAEGTIGTGTSGSLMAYLNASGKVYAKSTIVSDGTIAAANSIQIGSGSCTSSSDAGKIQWNGTKIQFCDGSVWKNFGGLDRQWYDDGLPAGSMVGAIWQSNCTLLTQNTHGYEMQLALSAYSAGFGNASAAIKTGPTCGSLTYVGGSSFGFFGFQAVASAQAVIPDGWFWQIQAYWAGSVSGPVLVRLY